MTQKRKNNSHIERFVYLLNLRVSPNSLDIKELSDIAGRKYINDVCDTSCVFIRRNTYEFLR